jgi:hypothetical protein
MKKSIVLLSAFFICLMLITPSKIQASDTNLWASVETQRVLQGSGHFDIWFTEVNNVFTNKRFRIEGSHPRFRELIAVVLTVYNSGDLIRVNFDDGTIAIIRQISFFPN